VADLCIHEMVPSQCTICLHGPTPRVEQGDTSECRSCGAPIIWTVTEKGNRMPIDAEPSSDGRFRKERVLPNGDKLVHFVKDSELVENTARLYASHFQSCPDSKDWKKK
jgi:hypothetical protein